MDEALAGLVGTWRGGGTGEFPTMESFAFTEEVTFQDAGDAGLLYRLRAWSENGERVLHAETGVWRADDRGAVAISVALSRTAEVSEGSIVDGRIELASTSMARAKGGSGLVAVRRTYQLDGDTLSYEFAMATMGVPEVTHHIRGRLNRVPAPGAAAQSRVK
jgi:hypothetical protein